MYRSTLRTLGLGHLADGFGLCLAPEGAPAGAGPAPVDQPAPAAADTGDISAAESGGETTTPDPAPGGDDDDADVDDFEQAIDHLPEQNLRTHLRRAQRRLAKTRPIVDRLRDPQTGRFLTADDVDRLRFEASEYRALDRVLQRSPDLVGRILEAQRRLDSGEDVETVLADTTARPSSATSPAPGRQDQHGQVDGQPWNDETYPYERESEQGQFLYNALKAAHEDRQRLRDLERRLTAREQRDEKVTHEQLEGRWRESTIAASNQLREEARKPFVRAVYREFLYLRDTGRLTKANAETVITQALADYAAFKVAAKPGSGTPATTKRQSEMVASNATLPRVPRPGAMTPTTGTPQPTGQRETLSAARSAMFRRFGKDTPKI